MSTWRCRTCGQRFALVTAAEFHVRTVHRLMTFQLSKRAENSR